jgi:glycosyltransferase involved in cell wall biosynthesis
MVTYTDGVLVSVIMIFRDAERFFDEAIRSVMAQTHPRLELLLCDDGSRDGSTSTAQRWAAEQPTKVRYLEHAGHAHRGMSSTRNLGIAAASGDFVAFLDADDVWKSTHVEHEVELLLEHPEAGLVCGQAVDWYSWEDPRADDVQGPLPWPPGTVISPRDMLTALLRRGAFRTPVCNLMVRRDVLLAVGGSEDRFRAVYEDQVLLAKLYLTRTCVISGTRTARYRRHAESSTARALRDGTYDPVRPNHSREAFLRWLSSYLRAEGGHEPELSALLDAALQPYDQMRSPVWRSPISAARAALPPASRRLIRGAVRRARSLGPVRWGSLRRLVPLSREFGYDRGLPVDRFYVERFLAQNAHAIAGRVLEVGDSEYTHRFGGNKIARADVLNIEDGHPETTIVADLAEGDTIPSATFDCLIITQTLQLLYDLSAAVKTLHRILRPGGTLLATFPGISPISSDRWSKTWFWSLTPLAAARLFGDVFGAENVEVSAHGNVLTTVAFLEGIAERELRAAELEFDDPQFPMLVTVRAYRPKTSPLPSGERADRDRTAVVSPNA